MHTLTHLEDSLSTRIFYFSGTGNSYWIAKRIATSIGKNVELTAIQTVTNDLVVDEACVGFVVPVYFASIPDFVKSVLEKLSFKEAAYLFCIVNCGAIAGNALAELTGAIEKKGAKVSAGYTMFMPDNSIVFLTPDKQKMPMLEASYAKIDEIVKVAEHREKRPVESTEKIIYKVLKHVSSWMLLDMMGGRKPSVETGCTGCGKCASFCPAGNITMKEKRPVFGSRCAHCFGCGHWCKSRAIKFGRCRITDRTVWTHPEVTLEELSAGNRKSL